jgi:hypothetical protein
VIGPRLLGAAAGGAAAAGVLGLGLALGLAGGVEGLATGRAHGWEELPALWLRLWPVGLGAGLGFGAGRLARTGAVVAFELSGWGARARARAGAGAAGLAAALGLGLLVAGAAERGAEPAGGWVVVDGRFVEPESGFAVPVAGGRVGRPVRPPEAARVERARVAAAAETAGWAAAPPHASPVAAVEAAVRLGRVPALVAVGAWLWASAGRRHRAAWGAAAGAALVVTERAGAAFALEAGQPALAAAPAVWLACAAGLLALRAR